MKAFFLDLASNNTDEHQKACIACVSEQETVVMKTVDHRMSDDQLLPAIEALLQKADWTYQDLTHIACIVGPGGFTSLRMAVSLANVLADQLKIPAAGIHLSDLYQTRMCAEETSDSDVFTRMPLIWMHSTKKTELFVRTFGIADSPWTEPTLVPIGDVVTRVGVWHTTPLRWCGELIPEHRQALAALDLQPAPLTSLTDALPGFLASQKYGKDLLEPWYGRDW